MAVDAIKNRILDDDEVQVHSLLTLLIRGRKEGLFGTWTLFVWLLDLLTVRGIDCGVLLFFI